MPNTRGSSSNRPGGQRAPRQDDMNASIDVSLLEVGSRLDRSIYDENGVLLLSADSVITDYFLGNLKSRKVTTVTLRPPTRSRNRPRSTEANKQSTPSTRQSPVANLSAVSNKIDKQIERMNFPEVPNLSGKSLNSSTLTLDELREQVEVGRKFYDENSNNYNDFTERVASSKAVDPKQVPDVMLQFTEVVRKDPSITPLLVDYATDPYDYLVKQGINSGILAFSVASSMGYRFDQACDVGIAALIQDMGMMRVPDSIRLANRPLEKDELLQVQFHPIHTVSLIEGWETINATVRILVYQSHERCDGSGYPKSRTGAFIHPLAKLLGVVDTYSAMTIDKPFRKAKSPYTAMITILEEANKGRLDRVAARALINYLSLFPIGSHIRLSDGSVAQVIRSNGSLNTRPVVVVTNKDNSEVEINLAKTDDLRVVEFLDYMPLNGGFQNNEVA